MIDSHRQCLQCIQKHADAQALEDASRHAEDVDHVVELARRYSDELHHAVAEDDAFTSLVRLAGHAIRTDATVFTARHLPGRFSTSQDGLALPSFLSDWPEPPPDDEILTWFMDQPKPDPELTRRQPVLFSLYPGGPAHPYWVFNSRRNLGPVVNGSYGSGFKIIVASNRRVTFASREVGVGSAEPPPLYGPEDDGPAAQVLSALALAEMDDYLALPRLLLPTWAGLKWAGWRTSTRDWDNLLPGALDAIRRLHTLGH